MLRKLAGCLNAACLNTAAVAALALFSQVGSVQALTIDEFDGPLEVVSTGVSPVSYGIRASATAIGGTRGYKTARTGGSLKLTLESEDLGGSFTVLSHSQDSGVTGISTVTWDGDFDAGVLDRDGLGGIDLAQDGGDRFIIKVVGYDPGQTGSPIDLIVTVYDAANSTYYSQAAITFNASASDVEREVLFSNFVTGSGAAAPADFGNVGAITLEVFGSDPAMDLTLDWIRTNGSCPGVPDQNGRVIDECGVCIGDPLYNQSKDDCGVCVGQPGYNQPKDDCGFCPNDPLHGNSKDDCGVCIGDPLYNQGRDDCDLCPADPNYQQAKDSCGVCFGNDRDLDDCGVCGGNNLSKDACGICGGNGSSCADCLGVPFGTAKVDICGICDGDGTSCLDCAGNILGAATLDRCNVCEGDGQSCLGCNGYDQRETLATLDGKAKDQERLINQALRTLKKLDPSAKSANYAEGKSALAHALQVANWTRSWELPHFVNLCDNTVFCTSVSTTPILDAYREDARKLFVLTKKVLKRVSKARGKQGGYERKTLKRAARIYDEALELANEVPATQSACS